MGCLNDDPNHPFPHFFGNIHLSGPCNRSCYFCIGQHMMALDQENSLKRIPTNIGKFLRECMERNVKEMMGGPPCNLPKILENHPLMNIKVNVILGPENVEKDVFDTLDVCSFYGVRRVNLREPYGQPHIGDPLEKLQLPVVKRTLGMPTYNWGFSEVTYWDVHYVEVESVNLYANGRVSITYPITKGYDPSGEVLPQFRFPGGRIHEQWL